VSTESDWPAEWRAWAAECRATFPNAASALMPFLHRVRAREGWIRPEAMDAAADLLDVTRQHVESVVSFYTLFRQEPSGRRTIHVCRGLSCMMAGADELMENLEHHLGISEGQTTADGAVTLLEAECLAACSLAPASQVNLRYFGPVAPENFRELLEAPLVPEGEEVDDDGKPVA
jgi:NADH-quinone oxidoreductase subunit E